MGSGTSQGWSIFEQETTRQPAGNDKKKTCSPHRIKRNWLGSCPFLAECADKGKHPGQSCSVACRNAAPPFGTQGTLCKVRGFSSDHLRGVRGSRGSPSRAVPAITDRTRSRGPVRRSARGPSHQRRMVPSSPRNEGLRVWPRLWPRLLRLVSLPSFSPPTRFLGPPNKREETPRLRPDVAFPLPSSTHSATSRPSTLLTHHPPGASPTLF
ncbi:hypothetical protein B0J18DRAFT_415772 [Chaetomium sp. MPI-SDFR-AT-0129]|nr:hypothetical protein B0J18DRAFT_415772 [Chaetomium sp. MPI-SDFR-AT-0129]